MAKVRIIKSYDFPVKSIKGICSDDEIIMNMPSIKNKAEYNCVLAEELGHYHTTYGNILDQSKTVNIKKEIVARRWAYRDLLPLEVFIDAFERRRFEKYDMVEDLDVTEEFLENCIDYYRKKYGVGTNFENYSIMFEPYLQIVKWF